MDEAVSLSWMKGGPNTKKKKKEEKREENGKRKGWKGSVSMISTWVWYGMVWYGMVGMVSMEGDRRLVVDVACNPRCRDRIIVTLEAQEEGEMKPQRPYYPYLSVLGH